MLLTSPKTLEQAFAEVDNGKSGTITNLQFKKAFRVLNIALTSK
jgi:Ca2+-binding EF-hand superfamily protein